MSFRRILCQGDPIVLAGMNLPTLVELLARAIVEHLGDYAVVVDPLGTSRFFSPNSIQNFPPTPTMNAVDAEVSAALMTLPPRTVHFLVLRNGVSDAQLAAFLGVASVYFDVATPIRAYAHRFDPLPPDVAPWLHSSGRGMPAIMLPASTTGNAGAATFYTIDMGWNAPSPPERDSCRMRLSPSQVNAAAAEPIWSSIATTTRATLERWARTVTWRRVAICISGGGASVFRLVPLFQALEDEGLPIDLLAGVSGGTIFSSCYAFGGLPKVQELANRGISFTAAVMSGLLSTRVVKYYIDDFFDHCGVCNTEMRVLPLSTRIAPMSPPRAAAMVDGTFGEAMRANGGAPFFDAYFVGDSRQADGAFLAGLPPPFLAERFGADIVFAMNVLALPANRFPGETIPILGDIMSVFYRYTPLGRIADTWGASSTMLHTLAEGAGLHANVFVDTPPRDWAPIEQFQLYNAPTYSSIGLGPGVDVADVALECVQRWRNLP